jgi:DNA-binding CsgD family transcriptional regulator
MNGPSDGIRSGRPKGPTDRGLPGTLPDREEFLVSVEVTARPWLVGRTREWRTLVGAVESARHGNPSVVLVQGEAGIGKTALARAVTESLGDVQVVRGEGFPTSLPEPYDTLSQMLPAVVARPATAGMTPFAAATRVIAALDAAPGGTTTCLLVDDLHWVDPDSAEALAMVARRLRPGDQACVLAFSRPLGAGVQPAWRRLVEEDRCRTISLSGLSRDEVAAMLERRGVRFDRATAARLCDHVGGNPLYAVTLVDEASARELQRSGDLPIPQRFAQRVAAALRELTGEAQAVAAALAVLGGRAPLAAVGHVSDASAPASALGLLIAAGLVEDREVEADAPVRLSHPLVASAVLQQIPRPLRRAMHLRAARISSGATAVEHRVAAADRLDPVLADELEVLAGQAHTARQHRQAAQYYRWASTLSADPGERDRRFLESCYEHLLTPDLAAVSEDLAAVRESPRAVQRDLVLGLAARVRGDADQALLLFRGALAQADPHTDPALFERLTAELAWACFYAGGPPQEILAAVARLDEFEPVDPVARAQAAGMGLAAYGCQEGTIAAIQMLGRHGLPADPRETPRDLIELLTVRAGCHTNLGDHRAALDDLTEADRRYREGLTTMMLGLNTTYLSIACELAGRWDDAEHYGELSLDASAESDRLLAHANLAVIAARRGDLDECRQHIASGTALARRLPLLEWAYVLNNARIVAAEVSGDLDGLQRALAPTRELEHAADRIRAWQADYQYAIVVHGLLTLGRSDDAEEALATFPHSPAPLGWIRMLDRWLRGLLAERRGDIGEARQLLQEATEVGGEGDPPFYRAAVLHDYGRLLARTGSQAAIEALTAARRLYEMLGARPYLDRLMADLAAAGLATEPADPPLPYGLTGRERQIARLVAEGLSSREVAGRLYVSQKTVGHHLGNIFAKLGIGSRRELRDLFRAQRMPV